MAITVLGVSLLAPSALAADAITVPLKGTTVVQLTSQASPQFKESDAKISKDEAVALTRKLFPVLNDATVRSVDFGNPNTYPPMDENVWTIHWELKNENGGYGFSSRVDAGNGDLLQMYLASYPQIRTDHFPPKVTKEEAERIAKTFITQAAPSVSAESLEAAEADYRFFGPSALFGPVQYSFYFNRKENGVLIGDGGIQVTLDGDGNVIQFNKAQLVASFPSATPKVSKDQAIAFAKNNQKTDLQYIPLRQGNKIESWWLGYIPSLQPIDAHTGQFVAPSALSGIQDYTYVPVPKKEKTFTPRNGNVELTAEQAAQIVEDAFPQLKNKKLLQKSLTTDWRSDNHKVWSLNWGEEDQRNFSPFESVRAVVDAVTGEVFLRSVPAGCEDIFSRACHNEGSCRGASRSAD